MSSYVIKEREWDTESVRSGRAPHHYTTVRRYKVPDPASDARSERSERVERIIEKVYDDDDHRSRHTSHEDAEEIRIVRRTGGERGDDNIVSYRIAERDRSPSPVKQRREEKITITREESRSPSPVRSTVRDRDREIRYERAMEKDRYIAPYELEHYSKSTEYFSRPDPQPIIIRETVPQPIIIREEAPRAEVTVIKTKEKSRSPSPVRTSRAGEVELVEHKSEYNEETAVVPAPAPPPPPQEDYYYERVTREIDRPRRRRHHEDERRPERGPERESFSDDEVRYVRREVHDYEVRDKSPHTKRHLAQGAVAGLAGAALVRSQRRRKGEDPGSRGRQALGYATAGAVGAEVLSRAKKRFEERSRDRDRSVEEYYEDRDGRRYDERRYRSKSRRRSQSNTRRNAALAVAGLAAAATAAYVANKRKDNNADDRRNRSRHRRHSISGASDRSDSRGSSDGKESGHGNRRMAQAGLAGAALAGLADHQRGKSGGRTRSKSRVRQGVPIVAAGLGSAAVAGLYEKFKGNKDRKRSQSRAREREESRSRSRSRSNSRSRSMSRGADSYRGKRAASGPGLIEYGGDPIMTHENARGRRHSASSSGSDRRRRKDKSRSHSRAMDLATGAGVAGVTGLAVSEAKMRREKKREEKERRRREEEAAQEAADHYYDPMQYYPATNSFPPPPTNTTPYVQDPYIGPPIAQRAANSYQDLNYQTGNPTAYNPATYNPADYAPQGATPVPQQQYQQYQQPPHPVPEQYYAQESDMQSPGQDYYDQRGRGDTGGGQHDPENVSAEFYAKSGVASPASDASWTGRAGISADDGVNVASVPSSEGVASRSVAETPKGVTFDLPSLTEQRSDARAQRGGEGNEHHYSGFDGDGARSQPRGRFSASNDDLREDGLDQGTERGHVRRRSDSWHEYRRDGGQRNGNGDGNGDGDRGGERRRRPDGGNGGARNRNRNRNGDGRHRARSASPSANDSDETIDLPRRFDASGKRVPQPEMGDDALAMKVDDFLAGRNAAGKMFQSVLSQVLGGGDDEDGDGRSGRRDRVRDGGRRRR